jgi:hypothetical protein
MLVAFTNRITPLLLERRWFAEDILIPASWPSNGQEVPFQVPNHFKISSRRRNLL